ncbi:hypothetical protein MBLNU230_g5010t1 [Neophaeotheca triangularis]
MPPTPHQSHSFSHHIQASPNGLPSHPGHHANGGHAPYYPNMSFDSSQQQQQQSQHAHSASQQPPQHSQSFPNGPVSNPGYARSFGDGYGSGRGYGEKPQIYTAVYSGVSVYEMEINSVACMRRRSDGWLNATQILKVAGVDKGKRTKVLEKEILTGQHEKVQGGYGKYQGTWISYSRGREFCRQYGVEDVLRPLLDYDVTADGAGGPGQQETPTKEQAMAANRKRFYNSSLDARPNLGPSTNGTFFQNISPTTSVALAAMNKARLNSPAPRPSSGHRAGSMRRPSQQDAFPGGSQQSMVSDGSFVESKYDSGYSTQPNGNHGGEPPRKRMRQDGDEGMGPPLIHRDTSMRSATPTEPNESFVYENQIPPDYPSDAAGGSVALSSLPTPRTEDQEEKMRMLLDLFADSRMDYSSHPALTELSGEDLNIPLDASANSALHWAATLAKVPLLRLLIKRGANIWRGNAAGQSPLISAVLVSNCWEHACFPELLEELGALIEIRDLQGRTILHHIAVSSGIKGRAPSSKYYLEALLEFLVRIGKHSGISGAPSAASAAVALTQKSNGDASAQSSQEAATPVPGATTSKGQPSLSRFMWHIVNARDKAGNTALNLVARIGNRSIIQQLLEINGDPSLPNYKGVCAKDFGVGLEPGEQLLTNGLTSQQSQSNSQQQVTTTQTTVDGEPAPEAGNEAEELGQDLISSIQSLIDPLLQTHKSQLAAHDARLAELMAETRDLASTHQTAQEHLHALQSQAQTRKDKQLQLSNLQRELSSRRAQMSPQSLSAVEALKTRRIQNPESADNDNSLDTHFGLPAALTAYLAANPDALTLPQHLSGQLPPLSQLRKTIRAYEANNAFLQSQLDDLSGRNVVQQGLYRRVVALSLGVDESSVEANLGALVQAVESEGRRGEGEAMAGSGVGGAGGLAVGSEVGRVREFLRRVDRGSGSGSGGGTVGREELEGLAGVC